MKGKKSNSIPAFAEIKTSNVIDVSETVRPSSSSDYALYMAVQLAVSLVFIYLVPDTVLAHWVYLVAVVAVLGLAYLLFMKKYYHLHEAYLASVAGK